MALLKKVNINVVPLKGNLVDYIWHDRPQEKFGKVNFYIYIYIYILNRSSNYAYETSDNFFSFIKFTLKFVEAECNLGYIVGLALETSDI